MTEYFKLLENFVKNTGIHYNSIMDLTIDLAKSGGYYRDIYEFKCGTKRERTLYKNKFDSKLSALWILFYKKLFISKLNRYQDLRDYYVFIINKTFFITMNCINLDKLDHDDVVNKYVNLALNSRIKEVLGKLKKSDNKDINICNKEVFNNTMLPLEVIDPFLTDNKCNLEDLDLELEIREKLGDSELGNRLLDCLLYSNKRVELSAVDELLSIPKDLCNEETKVVIANAFNIIKYVLVKNSDIRRRFRKIKVSNIKYSFE